MNKSSKSTVKMEAAAVVQGPLIQENENNPFNSVRKKIEAVTGVAPTKLNDSELSLANRVVSYMEAMKPTVMQSPETGAKTQQRFLETLQAFTKTERSRFNVVMRWLLRVIAVSRSQKKSVFSEEYIYRFHSEIDLPPTRTRAFQRLLNLLINASGIKNQKVLLSRVDLDGVVEAFKDPELKDKFLIFFGEE